MRKILPLLLLCLIGCKDKDFYSFVHVRTKGGGMGFKCDRNWKDKSTFIVTEHGDTVFFEATYHGLSKEEDLLEGYPIVYISVGHKEILEFSGYGRHEAWVDHKFYEVKIRKTLR